MSRLLLLLITSSATLLVFGLWIPLKAVVAQELLEMAWAESQARQTESRPWPWADTWPVAKLSMPELGDSMIVLAGVHGESLAFGPGQMMGAESQRGTVIIAGHRDTHFRPLQYLEPGNELRLQNRDGRWQGYRVQETRIVDSRSEFIDTQNLPVGTLLLVTCYPFESMDAGGPLRYVVEARAEGDANTRLLSQGSSGQIDTVAGL
ncbi:MAG: sortase A [Marinobacter maritimus]|jgi:sortase A|uniref:class GN sortase n=1 Tax=Marinobacter maritimus TaxID=277961 RepID=UPI0011A99F49|nr:class GN sortase [Marinobacter maritimus]|tara:strand:- start:928 stop:1545 length:618 start_codon:yes stop_codon:yes gene_type:complete